MTSDPGAFVLNLVMKFCSEVDAHIRGSPEFAALVQRNRRAYEAFKKAIRSTAPPFMPCRSANEMPRDWKKLFMPETSPGLEPGKVMYLEDMRAHIRA